MGKANPEGAKWAAFNPNLTTYQVPTEIAATIGGGPTGGATALAPTGGFRERDLQVQFARAYTPAVRTATRDIPEPTQSSDANEDSGGSNKGAIIGGAVGGGIGMLLIVAGIAFCVFYRRKKARKPEANDEVVEADSYNRPVSELPSNGQEQLKSPGLSSQYGSPTLTNNYIHTPHGSPPPVSESEWSQWGQSPNPNNHSPAVGGYSKHHSHAHPPQELPAEEPQIGRAHV